MSSSAIGNYSMHIGRLLVIFVVATIGIACTPAAPPGVPADSTPETVASPAAIAEFVLPDQTPDPQCVPPCFYGVIPGQTTFTLTLALLGASPSQVNPEGNLRWPTIDPPRPWRPESRVAYNFIWFRQGMVSSIQLVQQNTLTLGQIVGQYGEPATLAIGRPGQINLLDFILIYPSQGLAFMGRSEPASDDERAAFTPTPDIVIVNRIYFPPMPAAELSRDTVDGWAASVLFDVYPWPGFGQSVSQ